MTQFIFVRHGETVGSRDGCFTGGRTDSPLTSRGQVQTREFVRELSTLKHIDGCITSTLQRTKYFGFWVKDVFGDDCPVFHDERLNEKDAGVFEDCDAADFHRLDLENKYNNRWITPLPCGESHLDVAYRVVKALKFWEEIFPDQTILIGSHTDVIRAIEAAHSIAKEEDTAYAFVEGYMATPDSRMQPDYPTDEQLKKPIAHMYRVDIDSSRFTLNFPNEGS